MLVNLTVSAFQNLLNLIELSNPNPIVVNDDQVTVSAVTVLTPTTEIPYNSEVTLTAVATKGFTGQITVRYNRLDLSEALELNPGNVTFFPDTSAANVVATIAAKYNLLAGELMVEESVVRPFITEIVPKVYTLKTISADCLLYTSEEVQVSAEWPHIADGIHTLLHTTMPAANYL